MEGVVTIVQEGRFQLLDAHGVSHLFLLARASATEPEQLAPLQRTQARVRVAYTPCTDLIGHLAQQIELLDGP